MALSNAKNGGFSLLELAFVMGIIALVILLSIRYYSIAKQRERVNAAYNMIDAVYVAGDQYFQTFGQFNTNTHNMIPQWVQEGFLPPKFSLQVKNNSNPWGGDIRAFSYQKDPDWLTIEMTNVPKPAVNAMYDKFKQVVSQWIHVTPQSFNDTFMATFEMGQ